MRDIIALVENTGKIVTLWHGGRDLESSYHEIRPHKTGSWEHGPGLYLTTNYNTASKYAKGGGKVYKVTCSLGNDLSEVRVGEDVAKEFIKTFCSPAHRKDIAQDVLDRGFARSKDGTIRLEMLMNLGINYNAIRPGKTGELRQFLMDQGADYAIVKNYGGSSETVVVIINPRQIKKVESVPAKDVHPDDYHLDF